MYGRVSGLKRLLRFPSLHSFIFIYILSFSLDAPIAGCIGLFVVLLVLRLYVKCLKCHCCPNPFTAAARRKFRVEARWSFPQGQGGTSMHLSRLLGVSLLLLVRDSRGLVYIHIYVLILILLVCMYLYCQVLLLLVRTHNLSIPALSILYFPIIFAMCLHLFTMLILLG